MKVYMVNLEYSSLAISQHDEGIAFTCTDNAGDALILDFSSIEGLQVLINSLNDIEQNEY